jgi:hypothetical protein
MGFTNIFGGNTVYPADPTFLSRALTGDLEFQWPLEQSISGMEILASEIELTPNTSGHSVFMPDAQVGSTGYTTTFYNAGADSFTVRDQGGNSLGVVASGEAWTMWLRDNSTANGSWRMFQMGAATSSANAADLAGAGLVANGIRLDEEIEVDIKNANYVIVEADRAKGLMWAGGVGQFTLPDPATVGSNWFVAIKNSGAGLLTIVPDGAETIDGSSSLVLSTEDSTWLVSDGSNWHTFGFGQATISVFDFIQLDVSGTGDYTLTGAELNRVSYEFTGVLVGNRNIIVPAAIQQYWVFNNTSGTFTLTVKTAAGAGVTVPQGTRIILYCDGTNVVNAQTNTASLPAVVQGDILYGSAAGILSALPKDTNNQRVLTNGGSSNNPSWDQVNILVGLLGYRAADKDSATARNSTTTSTADPDLFLSNLAVGIWEVDILVQLGGTGAAGFRFQLSQTGTMTGTVAAVGNMNGAVAPVSVGLNTDVTFAAIAGTNNEWLHIKGRVDVSVSGTLAFAWAQNSSNVSSTSVFVGYMRAMRVA